LFFCKFQPNAAATHPNRIIERLPFLRVHSRAASNRHLENLFCILEHDLARQRRFQIPFEKLTVPTTAQHETHIDDVRTATCRTALFARQVRPRKSPTANGTDLASQTLPYGRCPFPAHGGIVLELSPFVLLKTQICRKETSPLCLQFYLRTHLKSWMGPIRFGVFREAKYLVQTSRTSQLETAVHIAPFRQRAFREERDG